MKYAKILSLGKKQEDLIRILEKDEDFSSSKSLLEEELDKLGARVIWGVKFHPELMFIESCYRYISI